ncbi:hypothetical protein [Ornithinimicrobium kibberense]|uniref:hypothetical protein n=1 Tax=Ornithinimicrobium kibberense TaxID=282060 RepID=UPI003607416D
MGRGIAAASSPPTAHGPSGGRWRGSGLRRGGGSPRGGSTSCPPAEGRTTWATSPSRVRTARPGGRCPGTCAGRRPAATTSVGSWVGSSQVSGTCRATVPATSWRSPVRITETPTAGPSRRSRWVRSRTS